VLKEEYPSGIDVVYECVGGDMFETALDRLAIHGRLIVIGFIQEYQKSSGFREMQMPHVSPRIIWKSSSVRGFYLPHFTSDYVSHAQKLTQLYLSGKLKCVVDFGRTAPAGPFKGIDSICDAVEYLYTGKSEGKVVVDMTN
jgi:NADPH-dependent curcumin reductase CurA